MHDSTLPAPSPGPLRSAAAAVARWFDTGRAAQDLVADDDRIDWLRVAPFIAMHLACLAVLWVGVSATALWVALASYALRMFAITAFYHRYFSHKTFRTSRVTQFVFACIGASSVQRGPLWWAAHHRHHHRHADTVHDVHSPRHIGFWRSHMGWFMTRGAFRTNEAAVPDLAKFPELRWLDRYDVVVPVLYAAGLFGLGALLDALFPGLGTSGPQLLVWGFFVSTIVLFHVSVTINSLAHQWGTRRYDTRDDSRNNALLALLTFGEGWHNNHHHFPGSVRQGVRWWELDISYYALRAMAAVGLVWDLKSMPASLRDARRTRP